MKPGIYTQSDKSYHSEDGAEVPMLSASIIKVLLAHSPLHAWDCHPKLNPSYVSEEKEVFDLGVTAHALMLQGLEIATVFQFEDWRKTDARKARDEARAAGKTPILAKHWARVKAMVEAGKRQIAEHKEIAGCFEGGTAETTIVWFDTEFQIYCKGRIDYLHQPNRRLLDYKGTGTSVNPESIAKFAISQGWDVQSSFYLRGIKQLTGDDYDFVFVAQEDYEPYALTAVGMGPDFLWNGRSKVERAMSIWAECMRTGRWSGYPDRIVYPILPAWEEARSVEKELAL